MNDYDESLGKWIIDTDPGVDDAFAIIFAMNYIKENLIALSIVEGNNELEKCFLNAKKICAINKFHVPVYKGCKFNISCVKKNFADTEPFHGKDGLYDIDYFNDYEHKYDKTVFSKIENIENPIIDHYSPLKIIEQCYKYEKLNFLCLGPLTNLALAFMIDPSIVNKVGRLVIMGGAYSNSGNITQNTEYNFFCDPIAAKIVLNNFKDPILYTWEPCTIHLFQEEHLSHCIDNEKSFFCKESIMRKLDCIEGAIFADYGAAVAGFLPKGIKKMKKVGIDVIIDSDRVSNGSLCVNDCLKNKAYIIEELDQDLYIECFKLMTK